MEAAFATPTAGPEEPLVLVTPLEVQVAAIEAAVCAEAPAEPEPLAAEERAAGPVETIDEPVAEIDVAEEAKADPLPAWRTIDITEPPAQELVPALELAEVEDSEYDDEPAILLAEAPAEPAVVETAAEAIDEIVEEHDAPSAVPEPEQAAEALVEAVDAPEDDAQEPVAETGEAEAEEGVADVGVPAAEAAEEMEGERAAVTPKPKRSKKAAAKPKPKKKAAPAKRKPAKKAASLEDGVWLSDAIVYSLSGEWTTTWTPPEDGSAAERLEVFREKAAAGEFVIWGCAEGKDVWEPVKPAYWKTALIDPLSFIMGRENVETDPKASKAKNPVKYTALKVVQPDIEALWPPSAEAGTVRDAA